MNRLRLSRKHVAVLFLSVSLVTSGGLVWLLVRDWYAEKPDETGCEVAPKDESAPRNRYIEIQLEKERPDQPIFDGNIFMVLANSLATSPLTVQLDTSQGRGYANNTDFLQFIYDEKWTVLRMKDREPFDLVERDGSHRFFPFDSAAFDFTLSFKPQIQTPTIMIENHVHGFVIDCRSLKVSSAPEQSLRIQFGLTRDPLTQLTAVVLCVGATLFLVLILRLTKIESLATSVASFFFSLWSIRAILTSEIKTFPTLLDLWILSLCTAMIFGLVGKILWIRLIRRRPL